MKKAREYVSSKEINKIKAGKTPNIKGSFLIGSTNPKTNKFRPRYVGVSYNDLMGDILESSKKEGNETFDRYRLVQTKTNVEAWELECKTYHEFKEINNLTNKNHSKWPNTKGTGEMKCRFKGCQF